MTPAEGSILRSLFCSPGAVNPDPRLLEDCLPSTGAESLPPWLMVAALVVIIVGVVGILAVRRTRAGAVAGILAIALVASVAAGLSTPTAAVAADPQCAPTPTPTETVTLEPLLAPDVVLREFDFQTSPGFYIFTLPMDTLGITSPNEGAEVDWSTVDLQPDVQGIQHTAQVALPEFPGQFASLVYDPDTRVLTTTVNWSSTPGSWTGNYTVADSLGAWSNTATIITEYPA